MDALETKIRTKLRHELHYLDLKKKDFDNDDLADAIGTAVAGPIQEAIAGYVNATL